MRGMAGKEKVGGVETEKSGGRGRGAGGRVRGSAEHTRCRLGGQGPASGLARCGRGAADSWGDEVNSATSAEWRDESPRSGGGVAVALTPRLVRACLGCRSNGGWRQVVCAVTQPAPERAGAGTLN